MDRRAPGAPGAPLPRSLQELVRTIVGPDVAAGGAREPAGAALAAAIEADRLRVAYQPIVTLDESRPVAVEALVRLDPATHPELPDAAATVAVAEASGLISALGAQVLARACSDVVGLRTTSGHDRLQAHVNVSPLQLRDERFVDLVQHTLEATRLPADALVLELTETAAFEADGMAEATLARLVSLGTEIAIDDFGTGYASLELLAATPARSIKLDRSFVSAVADTDAPARGRAQVVRAAIGLGRSLGLRVVAEGIELPAQARTLEAWGCEFGQGYLYGRPETRPQLGPPPTSRRRPRGRSNLRSLSSDAVELAIAATTVVLRSDLEDAARRSTAQELASVISEASDLERGQADLAIVLAAIADAPTSVLDPESTDATTMELRHALASAPDVGPSATAAELAAAAWQLAGHRRDGVAATTALRATLGTAADIDAEVVERLSAWWTTPPTGSLPLDLVRGPERRLRDRDQASRRLRSLTALTQSIGSPGSLEDVLEVTGEEARVALGAASLSISRFERDRNLVRTLVNVGELAPWELNRPEDETYPLTEYGVAAGSLLDGAVHIEALGSPTTDEQERALLESLGKGSHAVVPIVVDGDVWGELFATTAIGAPPFTTADIPFLHAVANVIALAVQRTGAVDELARLAGEDPLTRLPNRRSLETWLRGTLRERDDAPEVTLILLDLRGLGDINDEYGHGEGDRVLTRVADTVARATLTVPEAFPARVAGDEFCIGLIGGADVALSLLALVEERLASGPPPQPRLVAGIATQRADGSAPVDLLRRADAAQYRAKQQQVAVVAIDADGAIVHEGGGDGGAAPVERPRRATGGAVHRAVERWSREVTGTSTSAALETVGEATLVLLDLNRWVLSEVPAGTSTLHVRSIHSRRRRPNPIAFAPLDEEIYELSDYPMTERALREGVGFAVDADDPEADPQERALLTEFGQRYVLGIPATDADGCGWLLELYGDDQSVPVGAATALIEAMASRTLGRPVRCRPTSA